MPRIHNAAQVPSFGRTKLAPQLTTPVRKSYEFTLTPSPSPAPASALMPSRSFVPLVSHPEGRITESTWGDEKGNPSTPPTPPSADRLSAPSFCLDSPQASKTASPDVKMYCYTISHLLFSFFSVFIDCFFFLSYSFFC